MGLSLIVAMTHRKIIGNNGTIPWDIPEDRKLFRELTTGNTVIMGRRTWESLPPRYRPLPNRRNIVVSSTLAKPEGVEVYPSLDAALKIASRQKGKELYVIGGARLYEEALPRAHTLHISLVKDDYTGDTRFPTVNLDIWKDAEKIDFNEFTYFKYMRIKWG